MLKNKIIEIVANDLAKYGIKECRMNSVASAYHISKKTLYEYFGNKQNMIRECIIFSINRRMERLIKEEQASTSPLSAILRVNRLSLQQSLQFCPAFYNDIKRITDIETIVCREYIEPLHAIYIRNFEKGSQTGIFISDSNWSHAVTFLDEQVRSMCERTAVDAIQKIDAYTFTVLTYIGGICTDTGREELKNISSKLFYNLT